MSCPLCFRVFPAILLVAALPAVTAGPQNVTAPQAAAQTAHELTLSSTATELALRERLVAGLLGNYGRSAVPSDFLAQQIARGACREPREGEVVGPDERSRTQTWTRAEAGADGWIQNRALNGGYLYIAVRSERARTMILDASGYYVVRVNGRPRGGEKYGMDWVRHPIQLLWTRLLGNSPVEVRNGRARIGEHEFVGTDLGAYFLRPRPGSAIASVGAVAWTGPAGWTAAGPGQHFVSGAGFPDLILFSAEMLRAGTDGIRAIGWFGNDWSLARGNFVWNPAHAKQPAAENPARSSLRQFPSSSCAGRPSALR